MTSRNARILLTILIYMITIIVTGLLVGKIHPLIVASIFFVGAGWASNKLANYLDF